MKRLFPLLLAAGLLSACSSPSTSTYTSWKTPLFQSSAKPQPTQVAAVPKPVKTNALMVNGVEVQRVDFRPGISSATVERLAKAEQCQGGQGAGLVTEAGPIEVYRMACDNGKVFLARCELRQCKPMRSEVAGR